MKNWFIVTFRFSENVHCTNLCYADSIEQVEGEYKEYEWFSVRSTKDWEVDSYRRRGMPIINL